MEREQKRGESRKGIIDRIQVTLHFIVKHTNIEEAKLFRISDEKSI